MALNESPLARLTTGSTFARIFELLFKYAVFFFGIGFVVFIPQFVVSIVSRDVLGELAKGLAELRKGDPEDSDQPQDTKAILQFVIDYLKANRGAVIFEVVSEFVFQTVVPILGQSAIAIGIAEIYVGRQPSFISSFVKAFKLFCVIYCANLISVIGVIVFSVVMTGIILALLVSDVGFLHLLAAILTIAVIVILIFLAVALMLLPNVVMIELKGPFGTIKRCWELANSHRCYIFCTSFCLYFAIAVLRAIILSVFAAYVDGIANALVRSAPQILIFPLLAIAMTVVYFNIRVMTESMNEDALLSGDAPSTYAAVDLDENPNKEMV